jgi:hypothetical protein
LALPDGFIYTNVSISKNAPPMGLATLKHKWLKNSSGRLKKIGLIKSCDR